MNSTRWLKQGEEPLFPNIFWEAPVNRQQARKLLVVGGHAKQFAQTVTIHQAALAAGIGEAKVVLPQALQRIAGKQPDILYAASTPAGSLARKAADEIMAYAKASDGVIFSDELSYNAETVTLLETLFTEIDRPLFFGPSVMEMLLFKPAQLVGMGRVIICEAKYLMKLANALNMPVKLRPQESLLDSLEFVRRLTLEHECVAVVGDNPILVSYRGQVSSTKINRSRLNNDLLTGLAATMYLQHTKPFEALTSAAYIMNKSLGENNNNAAELLDNIRQTSTKLRSH